MIFSIFFVLFHYIFNIVLGNDVGDICVVNNEQLGVCNRSDECIQVFNLFRCSGIRPTTCGFKGNIPLVCCPFEEIKLDRNCNASSINKVTVKPRKLTDDFTIDDSTTTTTTTRTDVRIEERISIKKCKQYEKNSCRKNNGLYQAVGGVNSTLGEFPHMVALGWPKADGPGFVWNCGGSLISKNFVVTAGHCTDVGRDASLSSTTPTVVRLGAVNLKRFNPKKMQDIEIESIIKHPEYAPPLKYNDIALLRLKNNASFRYNIRPICLWQSSNFPTDFSTATGWGRLGYNLPTSDILQKVELDLIKDEICPNLYTSSSRKLPRGIIESQLCAGKLGGGVDTCQGDSGGPLMIRDYEISACASRLVGITSFGIGCGAANSPAIYTRVSSYIDWIEDVVWK